MSIQDVLPEIEPAEAKPPRPRGQTLVFVAGAALIAVTGMFVFFDWTSAARSTLVWIYARQPEGVVHADSLVASAEGFALLARPVHGDMKLWTTSNGIAWSGRGISGSPNRLLVDEDDLLAFAGRWVMRLGQDEDYQAEASRVDLPLLIRVGYGSGRAGLVVGSHGLVAQAFTGDVFWAAVDPRQAPAVQ